MKLTRVIDPAVTPAAVQPMPNSLTATSATRVVATISQASRNSMSRLTCRGTSRATAWSALAPLARSLASSAARAGEATLIAASTIARTPATTTKIAAPPMPCPTTMVSRHWG